MTMTIAEIGRRIDDLDLWDELSGYHWAIKPKGTALPYFCALIKDFAPLVKARIMLFEGWQTFQDFIRLRMDRNFGFATMPMELAHYELLILREEDPKVLRNDPGYVPVDIDEAATNLCVRMFWNVFGVMMRIEADRQLPLKYAGEKAIFARVEGPDGQWRDEPLPIPDIRPHVEHIILPPDDVKIAKDLPFVQEESIEVDFRMARGIFTSEKRPRCAYALVGLDGATGERVIWELATITPEYGLRGLWESMPRRLLKLLISRGRIPGEIKILSGRMFRMLRPLCMNLPFKLSLHDSLPRIEAEIDKENPYADS